MGGRSMEQKIKSNHPTTDIVGYITANVSGINDGCPLRSDCLATVFYTVLPIC